jgi:hypothetical protein
MIWERKTRIVSPAIILTERTIILDMKNLILCIAVEIAIERGETDFRMTSLWKLPLSFEQYGKDALKLVWTIEKALTEPLRGRK